MASVGGNQPPFRGRIGGVMYYYLNGILVARTIGVNDGPHSALQLYGRIATNIVSNF
jgi:hypothetical protein